MSKTAKAKKAPAARRQTDPLADAVVAAREEAKRDGVLHGVTWHGYLSDGALVCIDQVSLPENLVYRSTRSLETICGWIADRVIDGATACGTAAAYGLVLHCYEAAADLPGGSRCARINAAFRSGLSSLLEARGDLRRGLGRMRECFERHEEHLTALEMCARLLMEARRVHREAIEAGIKIAEACIELLPEGGVLTIGSSGALAGCGAGGALGGIVRAVRAGKRVQAIVAETRPLLQGVRLAAFELKHAQIPVTVCSDAAAAALMASGRVKAVVLAAERVAANGDCVSTLGTYSLAVLARQHGIPFLVCAAASACDPVLRDGKAVQPAELPIDALLSPRGMRIAPPQVAVANPASDLTPASMVGALVTDRGVLRRPEAKALAKLLAPKV